MEASSANKADTTTVKTCKTCRYWIHKKGTIGECDMVTNIISDQSKTFEIDVTADDDSGLCSKLMTGENFGCIHHAENK